MVIENLCDACIQNNIELARSIIHENVNINKKYYNDKTLLHIILGKPDMENYYKIIKLLIENGININEKDNYKRTALHMACYYNSEIIIKLLVKSGANLNDKTDYYYFNSISEFIWNKGYKDIIKSYHNDAFEIMNIDTENPYLIIKTGDIIDVCKNKIVEIIYNDDIYLRVKLDNKLYLIHILVGNTFKFNKDSTFIIKHIDNNVQNNNIDNLSWVKVNISYPEYMCNVEFHNIPDFLYDSELYKICLESQDDFTIIKKYYKNDLIINSINDFIHLLYTLRYWCVNDIPYKIYDYIVNNITIIEIYYNFLQDIFNDFFFLDEIKILFRYDKKDITCICAEKGLLNLLIYAHKNGYPLDNRTCYYAARNGHLEILKYAHENGCIWDWKVCSNASLNGHLAILKYAHENGCIWDWKVCSNGALNGHLAILKYARENNCDWRMSVCENAAKNGHLDCLIYAHENGCKWNYLTCSLASLNGHLDCLKYAHENGCEWLMSTCENAAKNGHLDCLKYAHENNCPWNWITCYRAAGNGHLNCLKYAHENGCLIKIDLGTCSIAALNGHLNCLKYSYENGCLFDKDTCSNATKNGHLDCLKYAHENSCPWDKMTCFNSSQNGHLECLKYAHENGCPWDKNECLNIAKKYDHFECIKYIQDNLL